MGELRDVDGEALLDALLATDGAALLTGESASAAGRAALESAGIDLAELERRRRSARGGDGQTDAQ